jgi:hypothetical protein
LPRSSALTNGHFREVKSASPLFLSHAGPKAYCACCLYLNVDPPRQQNHWRTRMMSSTLLPKNWSPRTSTR